MARFKDQVNHPDQIAAEDPPKKKKSAPDKQNPNTEEDKPT
jgi:hypothetical protein